MGSARAAGRHHHLHRLHRSGAFFVTRARQGARFNRRYSHPADKAAGVRFDQTVTLSGFVSHRHYPDPLRRIGYRDPATDKDFVFITNHNTWFENEHLPRRGDLTVIPGAGHMPHYSHRAETLAAIERAALRAPLQSP